MGVEQQVQQHLGTLNPKAYQTTIVARRVRIFLLDEPSKINSLRKIVYPKRGYNLTLYWAL